MGKTPLKQPSVGKILTVEQLYDEVQDVIYNAGNQWTLRYETTTVYRLKLPARCRLIPCHEDTGQNVKKLNEHVMHSAFLSEAPNAFEVKPASTENVPMGVTNPNYMDATCLVSTRHFEDIVLYMKMRWLLRCHSALSERIIVVFITYNCCSDNFEL